MSKPMRTSLLALAAGMIALALPSPAFTQDPAGYGKAALLDQGWSTEDRLRYYFTSQGSAAVSYDIFLHLEAADSQELFRADDNLAGYGFVPYPADPQYNPDGLPIGVTKTVMAEARGRVNGSDWAVLHAITDSSNTTEPGSASRAARTAL